MSNQHRIIWFDQQVRLRKYPNSNHLSKEFEISTRQALRDIEYMIISMGAPLSYIAKYRGYNYTDEMYQLPNFYLTGEERQALRFLSYRYEQLNGENAAGNGRLSSLFKRMSGDIESDVERKLPQFEYNSELLQKISVLSSAISTSNKVELRVGAAEDEKCLQCSPLQLFYRYGEDYISICISPSEREEIIPISQIQSIKVLNEGFDHKKSNLAGVVRQQERLPFIARMKLQQPLHHDAWHGFLTKQTSENGWYEVQFFEEESFTTMLLLENDWELIDSPNWLKEKLKRRTQGILDKLENRVT